jgi:hypothetical protein
MSSNPGSRSIWIVSSFVTQRADLHPEYLACLLRTPPALFIKETERRDLYGKAIAGLDQDLNAQSKAEKIVG